MKAAGTVKFRVDGNAQIGLGHLVRSIALAQMLQGMFKITFISKEIPPEIISEIESNGFAYQSVSHESAFFSLINHHDIIVLDGYSFDVDYQKQIKSTGCKLVFIDDLHNQDYLADLIINHAPGVGAADYRAKYFTQFALGPDYALLRPPFLNNTKQAISKNEIETVFVCFGGSDSKNITQLVASIIKRYKTFKKIILVTGAAYNFSNSLIETIAGDPRFFLNRAVNSETMVDLIAQAQLAIVPCSGILQEVLSIGPQIISGMYVDNQKYFFEKYRELNAFESAGQFSESDIVNAIKKVLGEPVKSKKVIDGNSGKRLLNCFLQLNNEDNVSLRKANINDIEKTFAWANNTDIRKFFYNKEAIPYDVHKKWFVSKLQSADCFYYVGEYENNLFGSIRFDVKGNVATISYLIDPAYQNKGLGTILLKKGLNVLLEEADIDIHVIEGEVLAENSASVKVFKKLGYNVTSTTTDIVKFVKIISDL
ncbi:UDP-2,4-diacetamido-2,4,6-trideoxy-beta-L-altropyranose hydrolase [Mucilaginibacter sp. AW1-3]